MAARTTPSRLALLSVLAAALGLVAGGAAWVLLRLIGLITNLALFWRFEWTVPSFAQLDTGPRIIVAAVAGGLIVSLLALWSPEIRGHGIPEAMEAVLTKQSRISPRAALAKPLSAAIAIGTGGPFGAEGPIIVTGGALGSLVGQVLPVSPSERKILLACGAAGGMAATFGTPLASVVLAIELLLFELSARAFVPLVVSAALAGGVHSALFGTGPLFAVPPHDYNGLDKLPLYALLGILCGTLAVVITRGLFLVENLYRRLPIPEFWHPPLGAVGFAVVGLIVPRALGVGYDAIGDILASRLAITTLAALATAKLLAWWIALASGTSGGTLAPVLLISGAAGSMLGSLADLIVPGAHISPGGFALVAMAATFGASVRATFTAIVFVFELTRDYQIILPLMLASVLAELVAGAMLRESLMTEKLSRRGVRVASDYEADILETTLVRDVMASPVTVLSPSVTIAEVRERIRSEGHGAYPLVDEHGRCVGIVAREDVLKEIDDEGAAVVAVASPDVVTVAPDDSLLVALQRILTENVGHLPVVSGDQLVGMCTRTDVLRARQRRMESERLQPGWTLPRRRRHASPNGSKEVRAVRRYLVIANQTLRGEALMSAIRARLTEGDSHFHILVPATRPQDVYSKVLAAYAGDPEVVSSEAEIRMAARARLDAELTWLRDAGIPATGEVGDPDPLTAACAVLETQAFDEIILSTLPAGISRWLHTDLPRRLEHSVDIPVAHVCGPAPGKTDRT